MHFNIDQKFKAHFKNLKQVFLYIIDECNLRCVQCLYKPNLTFNLKNKEIKIETAIALISDFYELGAIKLTILGGEPTLYGISDNYKPLLALIKTANEIGYRYLRMSTNGIFNSELLKNLEFKLLNEIAFSLDGFSPQLNNPIRGEGSFEKSVRNIKKAVKLGYNVSITCCIHNKLLERDNKGILLIESMIKFAESLKVKSINFHDLFKCYVPMDTWTGNINPSVESWIQVYLELKKKIELKKYNIDIRLPQCFIKNEEFNKHPEYYGYCPVKLGERVMVHPNGIIRICSNLICSSYGVARYFNNRIIWDNADTNETLKHQFNKMTPCTNRIKISYGNYVPLCFSFKPKQNEIIWKNLNWEKKKM